MSSFAAAGSGVSVPSNNGSAPDNGLHLRLPATSANLGPAFDAAALALTLALEIDAQPAAEFRIVATGRNTDVCSSLDRNLMLEVYRRTLAANHAEAAPLSMAIRNEIPIGMGCGSSAAVRLAGIALANHFGELGWSRQQVLDEASRLEGHPDNTAACWLGGFTVAAVEDGHVHSIRIEPPAAWRVLLVLPEKPLPTVAARAVLPAAYDRADAVFNVQRASLMTGAFASGRGDLLQAAMQDRMHQPFRGAMCPLLPCLLPLAGTGGILGVALSGAGPSVLLVVESGAKTTEARATIAGCLKEPVELIECGIETAPAIVEIAKVGE